MEEAKGKNRIRSVKFEYVGTDEQYVRFLKNIIRDYIGEHTIAPENCSVAKRKNSDK